MGNQAKRVSLVGRMTWAGMIEYSAATLPTGNEYKDFYGRPVSQEKAQEHFSLGQPVYVDGLRLVKF